MSDMVPNDTRDNKKPNNAQDLNDHHIITSRYTVVTLISFSLRPAKRGRRKLRDFSHQTAIFSVSSKV